MMIGIQPGSCQGFTALTSLRDEWGELHRRSPRATTFNCLEHVELWYQRFSPPDAMRVYPVRRGGQTLGFLPLVAGRQRGLRMLRSLTNAHCCHGEALIGAQPEAEFAAAFLETLARERGWDVLLFEDEYSFNGASLFPVEALRASGLRWEKLERPTFLIKLGKPFEEYLRQDLSRRRRSYIANHAHKVERAGGAGYEHLRGAAAAAAWEDFVAIEDAGWKGDAGTSIRRETQPLRDYYRGLVDLLARQGRLVISFMNLGGRRIAGGFGHLQNGVLHLAKMGYREEFSEYAPSNLLLLQLVKDAGEVFPEGRAIHLYPWDHGYKHRFVNDTAEAVSTWVFNSTLKGQAAWLWRSRRSRRTARLRAQPPRTQAAAR